MKTYYDHYITLPRRQAINAIKNCRLRTCEAECETLAHAIEFGFVWERTPQGHAYWDRVFRRVSGMVPKVKPLSKIILPPLVNKNIFVVKDLSKDTKFINDRLQLLKDFGNTKK